MKLTKEYKTIATVGFRNSVSVKNYNPYAHGGVCHFQVRRTNDGGILGRKVNINGRHYEIGEGHRIDQDTYLEWSKMGDCR